KKALTLAALAIFTISLAALAGDKAKSAGEKKASGTIAKVDTAAKSLTVTDSKGATTTFHWNDSTRILGGELKEGAAVEVGYTDGADMWATWIRVGEAAK
ncbi:MAG TPA: hypothetical protein VIY96_02605, partial [Thermoanaerobaculia bacterium]